ncbi:hypothetical protein ERO13_D08G211375v2, partial [Gossypium hirsutum]
SEPIEGHDDNNNSNLSLRITWHVHTVNDLSDGKILLVHCKSKDDNLGIHNLTVGSEFSWKFKQQILGATLFWCYMAYDNFYASFDVFWVTEVFLHKCNYHDCIWIARDDEIYLKIFPDQHDEYTHSWESGRLL